MHYSLLLNALTNSIVQCYQQAKSYLKHLFSDNHQSLHLGLLAVRVIKATKKS